MKSSLAAFVAVVAIFTSGCAGMEASQSPVTAPVSAQSRTSSASFAAALRRTVSLPRTPGSAALEPAMVSPDLKSAAAYCAQTGGQVYVRTPEYDTNDTQPLVLAGHAPFCQYTSSADGSRIHILLTTLYSKKPSLAALAYILKPAIGSCNGNPASCYCTLLGASDQFGGLSGAGGSWVNSKSEDQNLEACMFPDGSSIDSWGLTYHSGGVTRGIDLTTVLRYKYPG
jgi:putative hemolysin